MHAARGAMTSILRFLFLHPDLVKLLIEAMGSGVEKKDLVSVIKKEMVIKSRELMMKELGRRN